MLPLLFRASIWSVMGASAVAGTLQLPVSLKAEPAPTDEQEIAYCNTENFAIKIYTYPNSRPEVAGADAYIRIYDRSDNLSFINRTPVRQQSGLTGGIAGTTYENLRGENQWQLFMANNPGEGFDPESPNADPDTGVYQCILSRDGEAIAYGEGRVDGTVGGSGYYPGTATPDSPGGSGYYPGEEPSRPSLNGE